MFSRGYGRSLRKVEVAKMRRPPVMAAWILKHLSAGEPNESLAGDLVEELRWGRSSSWYWRQALAAVLASHRRAFAEHWTAMVFAAFWSLLAPSWEGLVQAGNYHVISRLVSGFAWPWSSLLGVTAAIVIRLAFVWSGLLLYLAVDAGQSAHTHLLRLWAGFRRSTWIFAPVWVPLHLLGDMLSAHFSPHHGMATPANSFGLRTVPEALAFFVTTLFAIWTDRHMQRDEEGASGTW